MEPVTNILTSLAVNYFSNITTPIVVDYFHRVFKEKPGLKEKLINAKSNKEIEELFNESVGVINATASSGEIKVYSAIIEAINGIKFNHSDGTVRIRGTKMEAPIIVTGGSVGATGNTIISGTEMKTTGTSISVGEGASIQISGNAQIRQG